jgi:mono/diheme cytochrome c family protein
VTGGRGRVKTTGRQGAPRWILRSAPVFLALVGAGCTPFDNAIVAIFGRSMRDQPSLGSYESPLLPPEGSVPFAAGNFPAGPGMVNVGQAVGSPVPPPVTQADVAQALGNPEGFPQVTAIPNPVAVSEASLARGEQMFNRACSPCHGTAGVGDGPITEVVSFLGVSLLTERAMGLSDGYIYSIIRVGRASMPPYGHQVSHFDRWHIVNYVRQLQGLAQAPEDVPAEAPADAPTADSTAAAPPAAAPPPAR